LPLPTCEEDVSLDDFGMNSGSSSTKKILFMILLIV
jgi:hypothetical protein